MSYSLTECPDYEIDPYIPCSCCDKYFRGLDRDGYSMCDNWLHIQEGDEDTNGPFIDRLYDFCSENCKDEFIQKYVNDPDYCYKILAQN